MKSVSINFVWDSSSLFMFAFHHVHWLRTHNDYIKHTASFCARMFWKLSKACVRLSRGNLYLLLPFIVLPQEFSFEEKLKARVSERANYPNNSLLSFVSFLLPTQDKRCLSFGAIDKFSHFAIIISESCFKTIESRLWEGKRVEESSEL